MTKCRAFVAIFSVAAVSLVAWNAQAQSPSRQAKAAQFREIEAALQDQSRNSASGSKPVNTAEKAADPFPRAHTRAEKKTLFAGQEMALQDASRSSASGSTRGNKGETAADPVPKTANNAERRARFLDDEKTFQKYSTP